MGKKSIIEYAKEAKTEEEKPIRNIVLKYDNDQKKVFAVITFAKFLDSRLYTVYDIDTINYFLQCLKTQEGITLQELVDSKSTKLVITDELMDNKKVTIVTSGKKYQTSFDLSKEQINDPVKKTIFRSNSEEKKNSKSDNNKKEKEKDDEEKTGITKLRIVAGALLLAGILGTGYLLGSCSHRGVVDTKTGDDSNNRTKQEDTLKGDETTATPDAELISRLQNTATPSPTMVVTATPTQKPTAKPTATPTQKPTVKPTATATATPTQKPTAKPTQKPTATPTQKPTAKPTTAPTATPTQKPTAKPTATPTQKPTATPAPVVYDIETKIQIANETCFQYQVYTLEDLVDQSDRATISAISSLRNSVLNGSCTPERFMDCSIAYMFGNRSTFNGQNVKSFGKLTPFGRYVILVSSESVLQLCPDYQTVFENDFYDYNGLVSSYDYMIDYEYRKLTGKGKTI